MGRQTFNFGNVQGEVIGTGASGVVAKNISGNIHIESGQLEKMPDE